MLVEVERDQRPSQQWGPWSVPWLGGPLSHPSKAATGKEADRRGSKFPQSVPGPASMESGVPSLRREVKEVEESCLFKEEQFAS